jgi:DNA repair protein RadD
MQRPVNKPSRSIAQCFSLPATRGAPRRKRGRGGPVSAGTDPPHHRWPSVTDPLIAAVDPPVSPQIGCGKSTETSLIALETVTTSPAIELRPYQVDLVNRLRQSYRAGHRAPLLQLATGAGKTVVFCEVARGAHARGNRVLVVAHRRELVKQASAKLVWAGVPHGIIAAGFPAAANQLVQVASIQTIVRRLDALQEFDLIVFDECHHCRAAQWGRLIECQPGAKLLGVTATPARLDGKGLGVDAGSVFDDLIIGPTTAELIDGKYLSPVRCFSPARRIDLRGIHVQAGDYIASELAAVVDTASITGDAVDDYRRRADRQPAIAFCATIAHAEHVAEAFRDAGYRSLCVHGKLPARQRDALIAGLGNGEIEVLTSCDLISEGLDVPAIGAVILLRPTKSLVLHRQQIGRGMRLATGKDALFVNDHVGNCIRHGLPTIEPEWTLDGVQPGDAPTWGCPQCECINPLGSSICANCGYERPGGDGGGRRREPGVVDGELDELTPEMLAAIGGLTYRQVIGRNMPEAALRAYARHRGYADGWVRRRLWEQENLTPLERVTQHQSWVAQQERLSSGRPIA